MAIGATLENRWEDVQHLKRAFNCFPDHMLIINPYTLKIIDANQTAQKLLGYSKEELLNLSLSQIDAAYNIESISSAFDAIIKSKEQHANFPTIHRRKDGSTFSVEVYLRCFTENGQPYILALATDTSVLKKVQDELNFHSILLNNITDAIVSTDQNFIVTSWNKYAEEIFGWSAQEAIGRSATSLTAAIYPNSTLEEVGALLFKNGFWKGEIITRKKSGTTFSALISIGVLKDDAGTVAGTVSVLKDISERKKKDEQIKYLAELVNKVSDAIISVDKNYDIVTWNSGATMIYGYEENEVMGKSIFNLWMRSNLYWEKEEILNTLKQRGYWQGEIKHYHKDDSRVWTLVSASALKDENGIISGFAVVAKDITERKRLEERLHHFNEELEQRVAEKTDEVISIFDRITDGFIALDNEWNFTYVNKEAGHIYGRDPHLLIGKKIWDEFPEATTHSFYNAFHQAKREQKGVQVQDYYPPLDKWIEGSIYPSSNGLSVYFRDITAAKKSEFALKESELRYRTLVETANEGILQIDENNIIIYANNYLAALLGYTKDEMIGRDAFDFISEANRERVLRNVEERKKGISSQHELTFLNRKQEKVITLIQSTPLSKNGSYGGSISMLLDITKRKQAEEQLAANERRFRALIENSSDGIALISPQGRLLYNSRSGEKITGYKSEEVVGADRLSYIHPDDFERIKQSLKSVLRNPEEVDTIEVRYRINDGTYKWLECSYSNLLHEPSINAIVVNYRDITYRKNAEDRLQKHEEQLSLIYNNSTVGMWLINVEEEGQFRYQTINPAYTTISGKAKEEVIGRLLEEVVPAKSIKQVKGKYLEAVQTGQVVSFFTTVAFAPREITAEIKMIPIKNEDGKVIQLLGTCNNVTEQRKARQELLLINIRLRQLASHLQTIREDERTHIAREIHDELGQQLTVLKMDLAWLNKKLVPRSEQVESKLTGSLKLIDATINTVRKIAAELRPSILDDLGLAEAIEWQSREFTERTGIPVHFRYKGNAAKFPPSISIGIFRIFQESLTNVARHASATKINCLLENKGNSLNLIVNDNGVGFNLNAKGERKTLGLLGMRERVTMLNGKYKIYSKPGNGTTVSVEVPVLDTHHLANELNSGI